MPRNVLPLHHKKTFLPIIWIVTEGEGDGIESRLPFKFFLLYAIKQKKLVFYLMPIASFDTETYSVSGFFLLFCF